jgi:hypothetical protein
MNSRKDRLSIIFITLAVAAVLTLVPLPPVLDMLRPYWVALVLIYWASRAQPGDRGVPGIAIQGPVAVFSALAASAVGAGPAG